MGQSSFRGITYGHPDNNFSFDPRKFASKIKINLKIAGGLQRLKSISQPPMTIFNWAGGDLKMKDIPHEYVSKLLGPILREALDAYHLLLKIYMVTINEIFNITFIEPIYSYIFALNEVELYINSDFIGKYFNPETISLIPIQTEQIRTISKMAINGKEPEILDSLLLQSFEAYEKINYKYAIFLLAQFLEIMIDNYLSTNTSNYILTDYGWESKFSYGKQTGVGTLRKYSEVLYDFKGKSLENSQKLWDDLDIIVQTRNAIVHKNEIKNYESKNHYIKRVQRIGIKQKYESPSAPKLSYDPQLRQEFPRFFQNAKDIRKWLFSI